MKSFKSHISEASLWADKYAPTEEFTLNVRTPQNAVHKALTGMGYPTGTTFKKSDETKFDHVLTTTKTGKPVSVTLEDEKGTIIQLIGSKAALGGAFNRGNSKGGGKMYAADWEEVITIAHNMSLDPRMTIEISAKDGDIKLPVKPKIRSKVNAGIGAKIIGNVKLGSSPMIHTGRKVGTPSALWKKTFKDAGIKMNPKSMTPKTDMKTGKYNISLKQTGGSQLMSGYKGDTMGVITAAYDKAMKAREGTDLLVGLEQTFGYMLGDVKDNFAKSQDVAGGALDVRKKVKASGEQKKNLLNDVETTVWETIQKGERVQEHIRQIMEQHPLVKEYAVEEAMTGNMKFSDKLAKSNYLMVFSPSGTSSLKKIDEGIIQEYASKVSWSVGIKSAQGKGALSLRAIVKDEYEPTSTFKQILSEAWDEIGEDRIYLAEGWWDKVKDTAKKGLDWAKEKALKVLELLWNKVVSKIINLLKGGYVWISKIFGWQPQVTSISNPYF
jgi:hypothetical protein